MVKYLFRKNYTAEYKEDWKFGFSAENEERRLAIGNKGEWVNSKLLLHSKEGFRTIPMNNHFI